MATLENTRQWTKLAGMKGLTQAHLNASEEIDPTSAPPAAQYAVLAIKMAQAVENGMPTSLPTLAEDILAGQAKRLKQYKGKAYPLSEKQVEVILSEAKRWQAKPKLSASPDPYCPMCGFEGKHHPSCEVYS